MVSYDRIEFLEFFDDEKSFDLGDELYNYQYTLKINNFVLQIYIAQYDWFSSLSLYHPDNIKTPLLF